MARAYRKIIAINEKTGEKREFNGIYSFSREIGTGLSNVAQALDRNGTCCGWRLYDCADEIRRRILQLQEQLKIVEGME